MKIIKKYQGTVPDNKILNIYSNSQTDTYSCDYMNNTIDPLKELNVKAKVLFYNDSGVKGQIDLNDNTSNYDFIHIIYRDDQGWNQFSSSSAIPGHDCNCNFETIAGGGIKYWFNTCYDVRANSTSIYVNTYWTGSSQQSNGGVPSFDAQNHIKVVKVIGFKIIQ